MNNFSSKRILLIMIPVLFIVGGIVIWGIFSNKGNSEKDTNQTEKNNISITTGELTISWKETENAVLYSINIYPADCDEEEAGEFGCGAGYIEESDDTSITIDWPEFEKVGVMVSALNSDDEVIKVYDEMIFER